MHYTVKRPGHAPRRKSLVIVLWVFRSIIILQLANDMHVLVYQMNALLAVSSD